MQATFQKYKCNPKKGGNQKQEPKKKKKNYKIEDIDRTKPVSRVNIA